VSKNAKPDIYQRVTDHILVAMAANPQAQWVMPWHVPTCSALPLNAATGQSYRGVNTVSLWCEAALKGYETPYWATYRQWQALGAQVRKGEKATPVVFWKIDQGPDKEDAEEADLEGQTTKRRVIARGYSVFSADQVDGWTAPEVLRRPVEGRIPEAEAFLFHLGADIRHGGGEAYYRPDADHIQMPRLEHFREPLDYYATLAHELGHWSGARDRLARDLAPRFRADAHAAEEMVAELTAAFQMARLGLCSTPRPDHAPYIAHYHRILGRDPTAIFTAAAQAQRAVDFLHQEHERLATHQVGQHPPPATVQAGGQSMSGQNDDKPDMSRPGGGHTAEAGEPTVIEAGPALATAMIRPETRENPNSPSRFLCQIGAGPFSATNRAQELHRETTVPEPVFGLEHERLTPHQPQQDEVDDMDKRDRIGPAAAPFLGLAAVAHKISPDSYQAFQRLCLETEAAGAQAAKGGDPQPFDTHQGGNRTMSEPQPASYGVEVEEKTGTRWTVTELRFPDSDQAEQHGQHLSSLLTGIQGYRVVGREDPPTYKFADGRLVQIDAPAKENHPEPPPAPGAQHETSRALGGIALGSLALAAGARAAKRDPDRSPEPNDQAAKDQDVAAKDTGPKDQPVQLSQEERDN
jgi:antirestriction protein ArdC